MPSRRWSRVLFGVPHDDGRPWYVQWTHVGGSAVGIVAFAILAYTPVAKLIGGHHHGWPSMVWLVIWAILTLSLWLSAVASTWWFLRQRQLRLQRECAQDAETAIQDPDKWRPAI